MHAEKAKGYYLNKHGTGKLNCAQAVIAAFAETFSLDKNTITRFIQHGRGTAPDGMCGALYAAQHLLKEKCPGKIQECIDIFSARAGSTKCKEIRKLRTLSCVECVGTAAACVEKAAGVECATGASKSPACGGHGNGISLEGQVRAIAGSMIVAGILLAWLVHQAFIIIPLLVGCGLIYAGLTDNCLMALLLARLPYNKRNMS